MTSCLNFGSPIKNVKINSAFQLTDTLEIKKKNLVLHTESEKAAFTAGVQAIFTNSAFEVVSGEVEADRADSSGARSVMKLLSPASRPIKQVHASK